MRPFSKLRAMAAVAALAVAAGPAAAQSQYPDKPVTIVVAFSPGGGNDTTTRVFADALNERTGKQFLVEDMPGANGAIGTANVANAEPDGYRLIVGGPGTLIQNPYINPAAGYGLEDFRPIARFISFDFVVVVRPELGIESMEDLVAYSKEHPDELNYGSPGVGNTAHQAGELIKKRTGADLTHVPYQGGAPATAAFLSGEVDVLFNVVSEVLPYIKSGDAKPLAVLSSERIGLLPDVPTIEEAGVEDAVVSSWIGLIAPAGTPDDVVDYLSKHISTILEDEAIRERLMEMGLRPNPGEPAALAAEMEADAPKLRDMVDLTGTK